MLEIPEEICRYCTSWMPLKSRCKVFDRQTGMFNTCASNFTPVSEDKLEYRMKLHGTADHKSEETPTPSG